MPVIIMLLVVLIGIGAYLAVEQNRTPNTNSPTQESSPEPLTNSAVSTDQLSNSSDPSLDTLSVQAPNNTADKLACAQAAATLFESYKIHNGSYENHYNAAQGKCFLLTLAGEVGPNTGFNEVLSDAYDNVKIAQYIGKYGDIGPFCWFNKPYGCTYAQFEAFLNSDMESTKY